MRSLGGALCSCAALSAMLLAAGCGDGGGGGATALLAGTAVADVTTNQLAVTGLQKTAERRVGSAYEYTYRVTLKNTSKGSMTGAKAQVSRVPAGTTIVDGSVAGAFVAAGASLTPTDTIVLRSDRARTYDSAALGWQTSIDPPWSGIRQGVAPYPVRAGINNNSAVGRSVATDAAGDVILAGSTTGGFANVASPPQSPGAFVAKYSPSGKLLWGRRLLDQGNGGGVDEGAYGVGVDAAGNIYVTGQTLTALPGELAAGNLDIFIAKYNAAGTRLWAHQFGSNQLDTVRGIAVAANGSAVIVGDAGGQLPLQPPPASWDVFIAKYDSAGKRVFLQTIDLGRTDEAGGVALDRAGNIYVAGTTSQQAGDFAGYKAFAAKFNGSGVRQWLALVGETGFPTAHGNAIAVAADGATVYLAGHVYYDFDMGGDPADFLNPDGDAFLARFDGSSGARRWIHNLSSGTLPTNRHFDDEALGVATNAAGSVVYIAGYTPAVLPGQASRGAEDMFVARYGSNGTRNWVSQRGSGLPAGAAQNDRAYGITIDPGGDLFVTGSTVGSLGTAPPNTDRRNWFVLKMKPGDGGLY